MFPLRTLGPLGRTPKVSAAASWWLPSGITSSDVLAVYQPKGAALVKDSTGVYHLDVSASAVGQWYYRWEGTGAVEQADEGTFVVEASAF